VQRQEKDLRREADRRHARIVATLEDNDLSGSGKVDRPQFNQLIAMIDNGEVDLVLSADLDRLSRGFAPYVRFYEACDRAKITVAWLGGEANFATGKGILELDMRASFAREELRVIRGRAKRKHLELAEKGMDVGGGRAFGYADNRRSLREPATFCRIADRTQVVCDEPALIGEAADRVLAGASLRSIATEWNECCIPTVTGRKWSVQVIKRMLVSARISGRRERIWINGVRRSLGMLVEGVPAAWPPIITAEKSDALRRVLTDPDRRKNHLHGSYLLTGGIAVCGALKSDGTVCGRRLIARPRGDGRRCMVCASGTPNYGCGKIRTLAEPVEALISEAVLRAIDRGALARAMRGKEDAKAAAAKRDVDDDLKTLARRWGRGEISAVEHSAARGEMVARQDKLQRELDGSRRAVGLDGLPADEQLRKAWPTLELHRRRAIIAALIEAVIINPIKKPGRNTFDPKRVDVRWRA
jgi:site-specific DNA recombinase